MSEKDQKDEAVAVSERDIEEIVEQGEAGVAALLAAYEPVEKGYFSAVAPAKPAVYATNTNFSD